jgi:hypothetical protein
MQREIRIVSHEAARDAELAEWATMSKEERLEIGAELHSFWVRNYFPDAVRMERSARMVQRSLMEISSCLLLLARDTKRCRVGSSTS